MRKTSNGIKRRNYKAEYLRRIEKGLKSGKSRSAARGHARAEDLGPLPPAKLDRDSAYEKALRSIKRGSTLKAASKNFGISQEKLRRHIKRNTTAQFSGGRWTIFDLRPQAVWLPVNGRLMPVTVAIDDASEIGRYWAAVNKFLETNDIDHLFPFEGDGVRDVMGKYFPFETRPNILRKLDPSQRLRFGAYQLRAGGLLIEHGYFYAPDLSAGDLEVLGATRDQMQRSDLGKVELRTLADFVENVFFKWAFDTGGMIIGFNLPFDLSRLAIRHTFAKQDMKGGFSFVLAEDRPNVRVKHLSRRAAFINFGGENSRDKTPDRAFFVDVKTLAATLTSASHSLESLAKLLGTTPKSDAGEHGGPLTPGYIRYGMNDVQVTWECFDILAKRYQAYGLRFSLNELYSEASLGKAFLDAMNIPQWRQIQPDFPPEMLGQIMSTYYGGRAEVHIRREITRLWQFAAVSHHTLADLRSGKRLAAQSLLSLAKAAEELRRQAIAGNAQDDHLREVGQRLAARMGGVAALAKRLGVSRQYLGRVLKEEKPMTNELVAKLVKTIVVPLKL